MRKLRDEIEKTIKIKQSVEETESFLAKLSLGEKTRILPKHPMVSDLMISDVISKKTQ